MALVLTSRTDADGPLSIDLDGLVPDRLAALAPAAIGRLPIRADGRPCPLGDLFDVAGDPADGRIECRGDFSRVHRVGAGMHAGRIDVLGHVGRHAGERMAGGTLAVAGDAGDWLAAEMTGGCVQVAGNVGDHAAAALPGSDHGLRGGIVIVGGGAGCLAAARMRRGVLAIGGGCGAAAAFEMRAGTVLVAGPLGRHPGLGMRRGSIVALSATPDLGPGFRRGAAWSPAFLPFLLRRLAASGFQPDVPAKNRWQQWHGDGLAGGRGEFFHRDIC